MNMMTAIAASDVVPISPSVAAFMRAFHDYRRVMNAGSEVAADDDQFAHYAWSGARDMIVQALIDDNHNAAAVALVAFDMLGAVIEGAYRKVRDPDEDEELRRIRRALLNLWQFADRGGGSAVRPFAQWVDAADAVDNARWSRESKKASEAF